MYLVVSHWEAQPGREADFEREGPAVREVLKRQPGVKFVKEFHFNGRYTVVHGYRDEAHYRAIVDDPDSEFNRSLASHLLEEYGRWIDSESGETMD